MARSCIRPLDLSFFNTPSLLPEHQGAGVESGNSKPCHPRPSRRYRSCSAISTFLGVAPQDHRRWWVTGFARSLPLTSTVGLLRLENSSTRYSAAQLAARAYSSTYMNAKALDEVLLQTLVGQIDTQLFKGVSSGCQKEQYIPKTSKNRW